MILRDGHSLNTTASGRVILMLQTSTLKRKYKFFDVLYVPELAYNLLRVSEAISKGFSFTFKER